MIHDFLKNSKIYEPMHTDFKKVFDFLEKLNSDSPLGKTELGDRVWVTVSAVEETPQREEKLFEAHRDYIDIQYIVSGNERFDYALIGSNPTAKEYNAEQDYELFSGEGQSITLNSGDFCILYPQDLHIPISEKLNSGKLIRAVAKIRI